MSKQHQYELDEKITQQSNTNYDLDSQKLAWKIAEAADDKKGADITILQVAEVSYLADYFVIVTGFSKAQVRAIADAIEEKVAETFNQYPVRVAGKTEGSWVLEDYGEVIVHIFLPQEREYYNLEAFWGHAQRIEYIASM
ncbi:MAG: ribosome silencing factor [Stanieria sp.]